MVNMTKLIRLNGKIYMMSKEFKEGIEWEVRKYPQKNKEKPCGYIPLSSIFLPNDEIGKKYHVILEEVER